MQTARFLIAISSSTNADLRHERMLRRADESRAVLFAQNWLIQLRKTEYMFGVQHTQYEVYRETDEGTWRAIEIGDVSSAEIGRSGARQKRAEAKATGVADNPRPRQSATRGRQASKRKDDWAGLTSTFGGKTTKRRAATLSPFQQRIQQLKENAQQALARRKAHGESK